LNLKPSPAIKATLCLVLIVGYIVLAIFLPHWTLAITTAVTLPLTLATIWWLMYVSFKGFK
jgi:Cu/Ag efflux pump CusA